MPLKLTTPDDMAGAGRDLYVLQMAATGYVKVGRSSNVERRMQNIQTGCPHTLRIIMVAPGWGHREQELHHWIAPHRTRRFKGEWYEEASLGDFPVEFYNWIPEEILETTDWWKNKR